MKGPVAFVAIVALTLGACGGGTDTGGRRSERPCGPVAAVIADPKFPAGFPSLTGVIWTSSQTAGPTQVVRGYSSKSLDELFREARAAFSKDGYAIAKDERDPEDAEVVFTSDSYDGQVKLAEECRGRRSVAVTIRPRS